MKMTVSWAVAVRRSRLARACAAAAAVCGLVLAGAGTAAGARAAVSAGRWRTAIEVPGLAALNAGNGRAAVVSVSCALAGYCGAGGYYTDRGRHTQGLVVSERNGRWGNAVVVPGLVALNAAGNAQVVSVSCTGRGRCAAGGFYTDSSGHTQGFVVSERNGRWGDAVEVPGLAALDGGASAQVSSVSCASAGNCAAGGQYGQVSGGSQAYLVSETHGVWRPAREVPLPSTSGGNAAVTSVSCPSAGNCTAGGYYPIPPGPLAVPGQNRQGFVVSETDGVWGTPQAPPGLAALNVGDSAAVSSVSCASAGNCGAAGTWTGEYDGTDDNPGLTNAFVAAEKNGRWGTAHVPSATFLAGSETTTVHTVSCPSAGNCTAVGDDTGGVDHGVYVVSERNGRWRTAQQLPGLTALNGPASFAAIGPLSCPSAGNCGTGGYYLVPGSGHEAFVVTERNGRWGRAAEVPGTADLNLGGNAAVTAVSCPQPGRCAVGGYYTDKHGYIHAFLDSQL
jgi:hypothetical protein